MVEAEAIELLLHKVVSRYGYDFSDYARASLHRRIDLFYTKTKQPSFTLMQERLMQDPVFFMNFVEQITVNVTEMFRDAGFYKMLREHVLPVLATYPFIRIWHAGCSTGEEVFSLAILLKEANLLHKSILYATDINQAVLAKAKTGIFHVATMRQNSENYIRSGGKEDFSVYYHANHNNAKFDSALSEKMIFSTHNLVADASFNEFQLILCRNVLIYFNRELQGKVLQLFDRSLDSLGFLALGSKESLKFSPIAGYYKQVVYNEKVWRKNK
ncbi:MAG: protein-glutamate O-methyltransferase CheR [Rhizobacter sp.]|nr:protein-glutamate O-methyltransferase CheR [Ferruginibacter sp.]